MSVPAPKQNQSCKQPAHQLTLADIADGLSTKIDSEIPARLDGKPRLWPVAPFAERPQFGLVEMQLHFCWNETSSAKVVSLLEHRRARYLDYSVRDFFRADPSADTAARGLEREGVELIGQLVQLQADDLRVLRCIGEGAVDSLRAGLSSVGLDFGLSIPQWNTTRQMPISL